MDPITSAAPVIRTTVGWSDTGCLFTTPTTTAQENPGLKNNIFEVYSADGIHWSANGGAYEYEFGTIAVSDSGIIVGLGFRSETIDFTTIQTTDGIHWISVDTPDQAVDNSVGIAWSNTLGVFLAFGFVTGGIRKVFTSPDGIIWTARDPIITGTGTGAILDPLEFLYVDELSLWIAAGSAVGYGFATPQPVMYSSDGEHWTASAVGGLVNGNKLAWSPDLAQILMLVFDVTFSICYVATSSDGISWTTHGTLDSGGSEFMTRPVWSSTLHQWACASSFAIYISSDGITWTTFDPSFLWTDFHSIEQLIWSPFLNQYLLVASGFADGITHFAISPDLTSSWTLGEDLPFNFLSSGSPNANYTTSAWYDPSKLWIVMGKGPSGEGGGGGTNPDTPPTSNFCSSGGTFDLPTVSNSNPGPTSTYEP